MSPQIFFPLGIVRPICIVLYVPLLLCRFMGQYVCLKFLFRQGDDDSLKLAAVFMFLFTVLLLNALDDFFRQFRGAWGGCLGKKHMHIGNMLSISIIYDFLNAWVLFFIWTLGMPCRFEHTSETQMAYIGMGIVFLNSIVIAFGVASATKRSCFVRPMSVSVVRRNARMLGNIFFLFMAMPSFAAVWFGVAMASMKVACVVLDKSTTYVRTNTVLRAITFVIIPSFFSVLFLRYTLCKSRFFVRKMCSSDLYGLYDEA